MNIHVEARPTIDAPWLDMEPVRIGAVPPGLGTPNSYILVDKGGQPFLRVDYYGSSVETYCFEEERVWRDWLAVGLGHHVYLIHLASRAVRELDPGDYFDSFWPGPEFLLVASAARVIKVGPEGNILWSSGEVGLDGVVIDRVEAGVIYGQGEWDPPGGWRPFRLLLDSGEPG